MNRNYFIPVVLLLALGSLLACSSEDDTSALGGKPLVLYAGMPMTRSTVDSQWTEEDKVAVQIGSEVKQYEITDTSTGLLEASAGVEPFKWTSTTDAFDVTAWSLGGTYQATVPNNITIPSDQSGGYGDYDLLYAKGTLTPSNTHLTFYHQLARVIVQLKFKMSVEPDDISVFLGNDEVESRDIVPLTADFSAPTGNENYGTWDKFTNYPEYGGVTMFHDATAEDGYDAAFSALLIPNNYSGTRFIGIDIPSSDMGLFYFIPSDGEANLQSGRTYTYRITVYNDFLDVTVGTDDGGTNNSVTPWSPNN